MKEFKTVEYKGQYFSTYSKERAQMITEGWKIEDVNLIQKDRYMNGLCVGSFVSGNIVYSREKENS